MSQLILVPVIPEQSPSLPVQKKGFISPHTEFPEGRGQGWLQHPHGGKPPTPGCPGWMSLLSQPQEGSWGHGGRLSGPATAVGCPSSQRGGISRDIYFQMILWRPEVRGAQSAPLRRGRACSGTVHGRTKPRPDTELCGLLPCEPYPCPGNCYPDQGVPGGRAHFRRRCPCQGTACCYPCCPQSRVREM